MINWPELLEAVKMLQDSSKKQLEAYNHIVDAILSMADTEVKSVDKVVQKPESVLKVFDKYGCLFEQFAATSSQ